MKRPDDQSWLDRLLRRPSPGQRGWDWAHAFIRSEPDDKALADTLTAHAANIAFDRTAFDDQFGAVMGHWLATGALPEDATPPTTIVTPALPSNLRPHRLDCMFCGRPGMECIDTDLCDTFPRYRYTVMGGR